MQSPGEIEALWPFRGKIYPSSSRDTSSRCSRVAFPKEEGHTFPQNYHRPPIPPGDCIER